MAEGSAGCARRMLRCASPCRPGWLLRCRGVSPAHMPLPHQLFLQLPSRLLCSCSCCPAAAPLLLLVLHLSILHILAALAGAALAAERAANLHHRLLQAVDLGLDVLRRRGAASEKATHRWVNTTRVQLGQLASHAQLHYCGPGNSSGTKPANLCCKASSVCALPAPSAGCPTHRGQPHPPCHANPPPGSRSPSQPPIPNLPNLPLPLLSLPPTLHGCPHPPCHASSPPGSRSPSRRGGRSPRC